MSESFRKSNKRYYDIEADIVRSPTFTVEYDGIYYLIICDNNLFCIGTNNKEYVDKGLVHVETYYNKKHRAELGHNISFKARREIPWIVKLYNYNMNSVDVIDQLVSSYDRHQRHKVWKLQVYNSSLQMMEVVAYQQHVTHCKLINKTPLTHFKFKHSLALNLVQYRSSRPVRSIATTLSSEIHPIDTFMHSRRKLTNTEMPECKYQVANPNPKTIKAHPMVNCKKRTSFGCGDCMYGGKIGLALCKQHCIAHKNENK